MNLLIHDLSKIEVEKGGIICSSQLLMVVQEVGRATLDFL